MDNLSSAAQAAPLTKAEERIRKHILDCSRRGHLAGLRLEATEGRAGLLSSECRKRAWPVLAGVADADSAPDITDEMQANFSHPEARQVDLDLDRSLHVIRDDTRRKNLRDSLRKMILAALTDYGRIQGTTDETRWYYQGLHDIAAVLLIVLDERLGAAVLNNLLVWHLKPWMEGGSGRMREVLTVVHPLLQRADPELAEVLQETLISDGMGSDYALPWLITWMTHSYSNELDVCARLVDLCLASSPIVIVYLAVAVASSRKAAVLEHDESAMHYAMLSRLPPNPPIASWIHTAVVLHKQHPPADLVKAVYGGDPPPVLDPEVSPLFFLPSEVSRLHVQLADRGNLFERRKQDWEKGIRREGQSGLVIHSGLQGWVSAVLRSVLPNVAGKAECSVAAGGVILSMALLAAYQQTLQLEAEAGGE